VIRGKQQPQVPFGFAQGRLSTAMRSAQDDSEGEGPEVFCTWATTDPALFSWRGPPEGSAAPQVLDVEFEEEDVAVLDGVLLAFGAEETGFFDGLFAA